MNHSDLHLPRIDNPRPLPTLSEIFLVLCITGLLLFLISAALAGAGSDSLDYLLGSRFTLVLLIEITVLGLPLALFFAWKHYDLSLSLGLVPSSFWKLFGGALTGTGTLLVVPQLEAWQARLVPPAPGYLEALIHYTTLRPGESLAWELICLAVVPALCEEAFFRGFLLRPALEKWSGAAVIPIIGILFGMFHLDPWRFPILSLIGILLTWTAACASSIWPAVVFHLVNNGLALVLLNLSPAENTGWIKGTGDVPLAFFLTGLIMLASGALLIRGRKSEKNVNSS
ncbi:MAG TPA: type II CAAX endopeptidase family protein [archaeon]|nr:type II CAAX endopeptidase family protein [archaeon]